MKLYPILSASLGIQIDAPGMLPLRALFRKHNLLIRMQLAANRHNASFHIHDGLHKIPELLFCDTLQLFSAYRLAYDCYVHRRIITPSIVSVTLLGLIAVSAGI